MSIFDEKPREDDGKKSSQDLAYGYEEEDDKSWIQKMVEYMRQKKEGSKFKLQDIGT